MIATVSGSGPPVVLHPSLGRASADFADLIVRLNDAGYTTIALDPPGIADLDGPIEPADSLHHLADDLWAAVDELDLGPVVLVGHAFGNRLVRCASSDRPGAVAGIVLFACGGDVPPSPDVSRRFRVCFDMNATPEDRLAAIQFCFFADRNDAQVWRDGWYPAVARAQSAAMAHTEVADFHLGGTAPMLVVQGLDDRIAPPQNAQNLLEQRPDVRVVALPDCGHAMLPEQPVAIGDAVLDFLDAQRRTATGW